MGVVLLCSSVLSTASGAVLESSGGMDVPTPSARCQEGAKPVKVVGRRIHCTG